MSVDQVAVSATNDFTLLGVSLIYLQWLLRLAREQPPRLVDRRRPSAREPNDQPTLTRQFERIARRSHHDRARDRSAQHRGPIRPGFGRRLKSFRLVCLVV